MGNIAIRVNGLGKEYRIGSTQEQSDRLSDQIVDAVTAPFRRAGRLLRGKATSAAELDEALWALDDISFEVKHGEVLGLIGRNGAGKSTLLKVLSRITDPTKGRAEIYGRVGSLLEVGTGFHPELTGRENIYLNGAILGMQRSEISRKFDEIVDFAEIEKFINTPVKHYSSGMYVRLAFAVAAHLEPEILLVDEVLAVGDAAFQKKCLGKMDDVASEGRTVVFVSHNMGLMQTLCQRGIYLQNGVMKMDAPIGDAISDYLRSLEQAGEHDLSERPDRRGRGAVKLNRIEIQNMADPLAGLATGQPTRFTFHLDGALAGMSCTFVIFDHMGHAVVKFHSDVPGPQDSARNDGGATFTCEMDQLLLLSGRYRMNVLIRGGGEWQDFVEGAALFDVEQGQLDGRPLTPTDINRTSACMPHRWIVPQAAMAG